MTSNNTLVRDRKGRPALALTTFFINEHTAGGPFPLRPHTVDVKFLRMKKLNNSKQNIACCQLDEQKVYDILRSLLPEQNDYGESNFKEELQELRDFNLTTVEDLRNLIRKHQGRILEIDREPLDADHIKWYSIDFGEKFVAERVKGGYWFALPGLLRIALELEFGEKYIEYSKNKYGI